MSASQKKETDEDKERTFNQEVLDLFKDIAIRLMSWLKPNLSEPVYLIIIKSILKLPVLILVILFSPIALLILFFTFIILL